MLAGLCWLLDDCMKLNKQNLLLLLGGLSCVLGFAPFGLFVLPVLALAGLFVCWMQAQSAREAAWQGFWFGLGLFAAGIGWVYVALAVYADMPGVLALLVVLVLAAFLALFVMLAGWLQFRCLSERRQGWLVLLVLPAVWGLLEWLRGWFLTGFPWLLQGYAQSDSWLAGYAPLMGVYAVSWLAALSAALLALSWVKRSFAGGCLFGVLLLWVGGAGLKAVNWTQPLGAPFKVALLQGNTDQSMKFREDALPGILEDYLQLVASTDARLIVLPETAFPLFYRQLPQEYLEALLTQMPAQSDLLSGVFIYHDERYFNSVFSLGASAQQFYFKRHLVPFGEYIPLRPLLGPLINDVLNIPMADLTPGGAQQPMAVAGQQVAVNICYEDVFGEEVIQMLPQASVLVNITNDAWYGRSHAAAQHNQIAQFRALESGRMLLRATNTGVTSVIDVDGSMVKQLPQFEMAVLEAMVQGYQGATPYVRYGNWPVVGIMLFMLLLGAGLQGRSWISRWPGV